MLGIPKERWCVGRPPTVDYVARQSHNLLQLGLTFFCPRDKPRYVHTQVVRGCSRTSGEHPPSAAATATDDDLLRAWPHVT